MTALVQLLTFTTQYRGNLQSLIQTVGLAFTYLLLLKTLEAYIHHGMSEIHFLYSTIKI